MPSFSSYQDRKEKVHKFITAYQSKVAAIVSFEGLARYFDTSTVVGIPPYDQTEPFDGRRLGGPPLPSLNPMPADEAKSYFDYLMALVSGTQPLPPQPKPPDQSDLIELHFRGSPVVAEPVDWLRIAIDQFYGIILAITPDIVYKYDIYALPNWEQKFGAIEKKLHDSHKLSEERWQKILTAVERLVDWLKEYQPILDEAGKDYAEKAKKLRGGGTPDPKQH